MWTANIISSEKSDLDINIIVEFTDGTTIKSIPFRVSNPDSITQIIKNQLDQYEKISTATVNVGLVDVTVPLPPSPTPEQKDLTAFQKNLLQYKQSANAEKLGLIVSPSSVELLNTVQSTFKPEYINLFN